MSPRQFAFIFGRNPELSYKETCAVLTYFGGVVQEWIERESILVQAPSDGWSAEELDTIQSTLGGVVRIAEIFMTTEPRKVGESLAQLIQEKASSEGKLTIGLSCWADKGRLFPSDLGKELKKRLVLMERSVRMVVPERPRLHLSAPQILHNKLVNSLAAQEKRALDAVAFVSKGKAYLGFTVSVQDIAQYSKRDFGIPKPDAVSGMLPPKLAQTMINLAIGSKRSAAVYDPFCGNGRVILEAQLLGLTAFGSDIVPKKVDSAAENMRWLAQEYLLDYPQDDQVWVQDARQESSRENLMQRLRKYGVQAHDLWMVGEAFLGNPLRQMLKPEDAAAWMKDIAPIYLDFLKVWSAPECPKAERPAGMLLVVPRARLVGGKEAAVWDLIIDRLDQMGYSAEVLFCYDRPDAFVRRDLVKLTYR